MTALYDLLATLHDRYPDLLIENVSGGGNRLDLGMLRYTDVAWMDDRTAPSIHVRHNVEGLTTVFPPSYLLSFAVDHSDESLHNPRDLALYMRSRMQGILGLCFRSGDFSAADLSRLRQEIMQYKGLRPTLQSATATLLSSQADVNNAPAWDVWQARHLSGATIVVGAFQLDRGVSTITVYPRDLDPATTYDVRSVDQGPLGRATGSDLMANGIDVLGSTRSAAHTLVLTARQPQ